MAPPSTPAKRDARPPAGLMAGLRVLLIESEERFRHSVLQGLEAHGFRVVDTSDGRTALALLRWHRIDVVLLDGELQGPAGEGLLLDIKRLVPDVPVIVLTGFAHEESPAGNGRLEAFAYLEKPCSSEAIVDAVLAAGRERLRTRSRVADGPPPKAALRAWLRGRHGSRPGVLVGCALVVAAAAFLPVPQSLERLAATPKQGTPGELLTGYPAYRELAPGATIAEHYGRLLYGERAAGAAASEAAPSPHDTGRKALLMWAFVLVAVACFATGALPIPVTALLVGLLMYGFRIFPPDLVARAYARDAVVFVIGMLALAGGLTRSGLGRRLGQWLLRVGGARPAFLFVVCPLVATLAALLPLHGVVALVAPIGAGLGLAATASGSAGPARAFVVAPVLATCFAANLGSAGSPAAAGRNALMLGVLGEHGAAPGFAEWLSLGLPLAPLFGLAVALYFSLVFRRGLASRTSGQAAQAARAQARGLGRFGRAEAAVATVLAGVLVLLVTASDTLGLGGPALLGVVALSVLRVIGWRDLARLPWDVVALIATACALSSGLSLTGGAIWAAEGLTSVLPEPLAGGIGLGVLGALCAGLLTNVLGDGATIALLGPLTAPLAAAGGSSPGLLGLAIAMAAACGNVLRFGTPNNAVAYSLAKHPESGAPLLSARDFLVHGAAVTALALVLFSIVGLAGLWPLLGLS